jgi:phospholipid/cholesterol/gamma-HCH transport system substrate-binding protein
MRRTIVEERTSYALVGAFVLAAVVVTVGSIIWILGGRPTESSDVYVVEFNRDVSGLSLGSPVRYLGVDVGAVTAMNLMTDGATQVAVQVEVAATTPIDGGTYASLAYQGITGVAYISLAADPGEFALLSIDAVHEYPVIPARDVGLPALLAQSGNITAQVDILLTQLGDLLSEGNRTAVGRSLSNIAALSEELAGERETLAALPQRLTDALDDLNGTTDQLNVLLDRAEPDLLAAIAQLNQTTASVARLSSQLEGWFGSNGEDLDAFVADGLRELPKLVAETRGSLRGLDMLLTNVRQNPSQLIYQPQQNTVEVDP